MARNPIAKVAFLRRAHTGKAGNSTPPDDRLHGLSKAFGELDITAASVLYSDAAVREVGGRLLRYDGVMDPLSEGQYRFSTQSPQEHPNGLRQPSQLQHGSRQEDARRSGC
jgi:hypothetical protein